MCLAVVRENLLHFRVELDTVLFAGLFDNMPASERLYGSFQQLIGLETDDEFVVPVNIACRVGSYSRDCLRVYSAYSSVVPFFSQSFSADCPELLCAVGRALKERCVPFIRSDVVVNEI